jgi:hypothetical protein
MELRYPRFIHAEFMTHRAFSRNASSSRAIPVKTMIDQIAKDPAMPESWGLNGKGMQAHGEMTPFGVARAHEVWRMALTSALELADRMVALPEPPHKQIVNRILEPFAHITVLVTATEYANFFNLRMHEDAQPEIRILAEKMFKAMAESTPSARNPGEWHLPFIVDEDIDDALKWVANNRLHFGAKYTEEQIELYVTDVCCQVSTARCARVSYLTHDGERPSIDKDLELAGRLMLAKPMHASPAEHQASPDAAIHPDFGRDSSWRSPQFHGNFVGWIQHRKLFVGENHATNRPLPRKPKVDA